MTKMDQVRKALRFNPLADSVKLAQKFGCDKSLVYRCQQDVRGRPVSQATRDAQELSFDDLMACKEGVEELGGIGRTKECFDALEQLTS